MENSTSDILVVHLGGLGDICLSESTFFSLQRHFGDCLTGLGNRRFFKLFSKYFRRAYGIESRHWLYLFSEKLTGPRFRRIVFIGKDRKGDIRKRWASYSIEDLIFIDMYPDGAFPDPHGIEASPDNCRHVEEYQLGQLKNLGIAPLKAVIYPLEAHRVIFYPESGITKDKWPVQDFVALSDSLHRIGLQSIFLKPAGLDIPRDALVIPDLMDIKEFFSNGGIFVSNDSGMAHLAGACGLPTITIFIDFEPAIWHPKGRNISLRQGIDAVDVPSIYRRILNVMDHKEK